MKPVKWATIAALIHSFLVMAPLISCTLSRNHTQAYGFFYYATTYLGFLSNLLYSLFDLLLPSIWFSPGVGIYSNYYQHHDDCGFISLSGVFVSTLFVFWVVYMILKKKVNESQGVTVSQSEKRESHLLVILIEVLATIASLLVLLGAGLGAGFKGGWGLEDILLVGIVITSIVTFSSFIIRYLEREARK